METINKGQSKHTKGVIKVDKQNPNHIIIYSDEYVNSQRSEIAVIPDVLIGGTKEGRNYHIKREEAEANAERIATCLNSHDELLAACEWARSVIQKLADQGRYPDFLMAENGGDGMMPLVNAINNATPKI